MIQDIVVYTTNHQNYTDMYDQIVKTNKQRMEEN